MTAEIQPSHLLTRSPPSLASPIRHSARPDYRPALPLPRAAPTQHEPSSLTRINTVREKKTLKRSPGTHRMLHSRLQAWMQLQAPPLPRRSSSSACLRAAPAFLETKKTVAVVQQQKRKGCRLRASALLARDHSMTKERERERERTAISAQQPHRFPWIHSFARLACLLGMRVRPPAAVRRKPPHRSSLLFVMREREPCLLRSRSDWPRVHPG